MIFMNPQFILLLFFSLASSVGIIWSLVLLWWAMRSQNWDRINCEITESRVEIRHVKNTRYISIIKYKYTVNGLPYQGDNLKYGGTWSLKSTSYSYCDKYPAGKTVKLCVDPSNPKRSVLEPGASLRSYLFVITAIAFGIVGFTILLN